MTARVIADDAEALALARELGAVFAEGDVERDRDRAYGWKQLALLGESGLLGITVSREHGGAAVSARTLGEVFVELSAGDASLGQIPQNHFFFVDVLAHAGTPDQQAFFAGELLAGRRFGNALSERNSRTAFEFDIAFEPLADGSWRLDGTKYYGTGTPGADWIPVYANGPDGLLYAAWVAADGPGVEVVDDWEAIGQRTTGSGTTRFTDVRVPGRFVVPAHRIFERTETFGAFGNYLHAGVDVGIATAALRDGGRLVRELARPAAESGVDRAADEPAVVSAFGELALAVRGARALLHEAGDALDAARADLTENSSAEASVAVAAARAAADTAALRVATEVFALVGTRSAARSLDLDRHWRNARTHTLHDPRRFKLHHIGQWELNGVAPPRNGIV